MLASVIMEALLWKNPKDASLGAEGYVFGLLGVTMQGLLRLRL